jgi:hypothetical protein
MHFEVRCNGQSIGHSNLEGMDLGMGILHGEFFPSLGYEEFRPTFQLFGEASPNTAHNKFGDSAKLDELRAQFSKLELEIWHKSARLLPTSNIHIYDFSADLGLDSEYQVEVQILESELWLRVLSLAT